MVRSIDRFGEVSCTAAKCKLRMRELSASALAAVAQVCFVRVSTVEASRSEGSVWISPVFAQTNGRSGEYRRAAENCVPCARAVSALAFAARAKGRFVRIVLVRYLRSEGRLSQISIGDRGSALGWERSLDAFRTSGSSGPFTSFRVYP